MKADGVAGFLLANGALNDSDTLDIRQKLIENDRVEAIVVLPRELFITTDISVTLWILNRNKKAEIITAEISVTVSTKFFLWICVNGKKIQLNMRIKRKFSCPQKTPKHREYNNKPRRSNRKSG